MPIERVTVFGGTGFLGRAVARRLQGAGVRVRVAVRQPRGDAVPDAEHVQADVRNASSVARAVAGAGGVVNAVGLYVERGEATFDAVHVHGARRVAELACRAGVERLVHISGIGADPASPSAYVRARAAGETEVRAAFPGATVLRPSVLFGPGDAFLATLDRITALAPVVPLFGAGATRLQPVHVDDVAEAVARCLEHPGAPARIFELGGASIHSYREVLERILTHRHRRRLLLPLPFAGWTMVAAGLGVLPSPPVTRDQVALMRHDNVVDETLDGFRTLGIKPRSLEACLPECLAG